MENKELNTIQILTDQGLLKAKIVEGDFPGFHIYLNDILITSVESVECKDAIICYTYDLEEEEPTNEIEVVSFKKY